jgi:hypothetical protein
MKKLFLFSILFIFFAVSSVEARWYNNHSIAFDTTPAIQSCNNDGDNTG